MINNKKAVFVWPLLALTVVLVFTFLIPLEYYDKSPGTVSFIGAALFGIFLSLWVFSLIPPTLKNTEENVEHEDSDALDSRDKLAVGAGVVAMFFCFMFFFGIYDEEKARVLKSDGIRVQGEIVNRDEATATNRWGRRTTTYTVDVVFTAESGSIIQASETVPIEDYLSLPIGTTVDLVYSKANPRLVEILIPRNVKKLYNTAERSLTVANLISVMDMEVDQVESYLNTINFEWRKADENLSWVNSAKDLTIIRVGERELTYKINLFSGQVNQSELLDLEFEAENSENNTGRVFVSDNYRASISRESTHQNYSNIRIYDVIEIIRLDNESENNINEQ